MSDHHTVHHHAQSFAGSGAALAKLLEHRMQRPLTDVETAQAAGHMRVLLQHAREASPLLEQLIAMHEAGQ